MCGLVALLSVAALAQVVLEGLPEEVAFNLFELLSERSTKIPLVSLLRISFTFFLSKES